MARRRAGVCAVFLMTGLLLCASAGSVAGQPVSDAAAKFYEDAVVRFMDADYKGAVIQLKNALQIEPSNLEARLLLGRADLRLGDGGAAEKEIGLARDGGADKALTLLPLATAYYIQGKYDQIIDEINPPEEISDLHAKLLVLRGRAYLAMGRSDRAESEFIYAAAMRPDSPGPVMGKARVLMNRGRWAEAEVLAERATSMAPADGDTWTLRAEISRHRGELERALEHYAHAIDVQPNNMPARIGRAATLIDLDLDQRALEDIQFVRERLPSDAQASYLYALTLRRAGDEAGAQAVLEKAANALAALAPEFLNKHAPSLYMFAVIRHAQKNYEAARGLLQRFLRLFPNHLPARKRYGSILIQMGELQSAVATLEPLLSSNPQDTVLHAMLGRAYLGRGRYAEAAEMFRRAVKLAPDQASNRTELASALLGLGQDDEAAQALEAARALDPRNIDTTILLGRLHLKRGRLEQAIATAKRIVELEPNHAEAYNIAGAAQFRRGKLGAARLAFEQALAIDGSFVPAKLNLAKLARKQGRRVEADKRYRAILEENAGDVRAMVGLSELAEEDKRMEDAISWREKIRVRNPKAVVEVLPLVGLYLDSGQPKTALDVANDLLGRQPRNVLVLLSVARVEIVLGREAHAKVTLAQASRAAGYSATWESRIARLQVRIGDLSGAHWSLEKAVQGEPESLPARQDLVALEIKMGRLDEALATASALRDERPDAAPGHVLVGDVMMAMKRYEEARDAYELALDKSPSAEVVLRLYEARKQTGLPGAAFDMLEQWRDRHPEDLAVRRTLASGYMEAGRIEAAVKEHEFLLERFPDNPAILNNLAWLYWKTGDPRAVGYAQRAYELAPEDAGVLDTYGWTLVQSGELENGLKYLRKAFVRASKDARIRYHLAVTLTRLGRNKEARTELEAALGPGADFEGRDEARKLLDRLQGG